MFTAPDDIRDLAVAELADLEEHRRQQFLLRLDRWWGQLQEGLAPVYSGEAGAELGRRLLRLAARAFAERDAELCRLDETRILQPDWFQSHTMLGYAAYAERFAGSLHGVGAKVDYLTELGVTYLHLMPLLKPRDGDNDGGYAVADYRTIRPDLGTFDDLRMLASTLRHSGISLVMDLVLNHVAREHEWAHKARAGDAKYQKYFYTYPDRDRPDAYERTLPEVFPEFAPGNFTWDHDLHAWVWTTFNSWQWDVNWANPDVFFEYADIILFLANAGVEVLRLDAIAFIVKRLGTNCQGQPEVHAITQALRTLARIVCPAMTFKAEAIVAPSELIQYFGAGTHYGKVSDIAYHNSLMVQIWSMLASADVTLAAYALGNLPVAPTSTAWVTYIRCHDDIGWAIEDSDAAAVGLTGYGHRNFLSDFYSGLFPGSPARGLVFQFNPQTGDRRISGSAASLSGLDAALDSGDPAELDLVVGRIFMAHAMIFGWGGIPVIWMGDELGLPNDPRWADEPGHEDDNRWVHRPRMHWDLAAQRHDPSTVAGRIFGAVAHLAAARAGLVELDAWVPAEITPTADPGVLPVLRRHPVAPLLELFNVTATWRPWPGGRLAEFGLTEGIDRISGQQISIGDDGNVWLAPYSALWITRAG